MTPAIKPGYLLGIGSNLSPHRNICQIIDALLTQFSTLTISRVLEIPPVGMNSHHDFLNLTAYVETDMNEGLLKVICNDLEMHLGRDRTDPASKTKDRPADLDILCAIRSPSDLDRPACDITDEYFLYPLIEELFCYLTDQTFQTRQPGTKLRLGDLAFGETATTIHRDSASR